MTTRGSARLLTAALVALACVLPAFAPGTASAATPFRQVVAHTEGEIRSDGVRFGLITYDTGRPPLVFDTLRGRRFRPGVPAPGCRYVDSDGGFALWGCSPPPRTLITTLSSGLSREPAGMDQVDARTTEYSSCTAFSIGRHWLMFFCGAGLGPREELYLNHRTGEIADLSRVSHRRRPIFDLNYKGLVRYVCHPLERAVLAAFSPPFGLEVSSEITQIRLRRCGRERGETLSRCQFGSCFTPQLGSRYVTWGERERAYAYLPRIRQRVRIGRVPAGARDYRPSLAVAHTCNRVFAQRGYSVYFARFEPRRGAPPCQAGS